MKVFQMPYSAIVRMLIQDTTMAKSSEAKSNANGKSLTLDESKTVTFNFQNTVSETDLTVKKTSYNGKVSGVWFEVQDENGKILW